MTVTTNIQSFLKNHKRVFLCILCALAMLKVFFFSAAFPFFNNVDEQLHFDTVVKYSKGYYPRTADVNFDYESAEFIVLYGSPEYFHSANNFNFANIPPPLWSIDREQLSAYDKAQMGKYIDKRISDWTARKNVEALSPPVYYALAGLWYDFLKITGLKEGNLLYGIRFLNVFLYGILFYLAYLLCKTINRNNILMQFGILLLLAFFPQDVFYGINSDVLSPLLGLLSLYLFMQIITSNRSHLFHLFTGIAPAAAFLTKLTNAPIIIIFLIFLIIRIRTLLHEQRLKEQLTKLLVLVSGCSLPIIFWLGWNYFTLGDLTGNAAKVSHLGWTVKPFADMWNHPIFTFSGIVYFVSDLLKTFWRGELVWGRQVISSVVMDYFYILSSLIFVPASIIRTLTSKDDYSRKHRFLNGLCALVLFFYMSLLAVFSMMFDFGTCFYPSRDNPFFTSGRLISGALLPFLILYWDGLRIIAIRINKHINPLIIVLMIGIFIVCSEFYMTYPVFESSYNWFHLH